MVIAFGAIQKEHEQWDIRNMRLLHRIRKCAQNLGCVADNLPVLHKSLLRMRQTMGWMMGDFIEHLEKHSCEDLPCLIAHLKVPELVDLIGTLNFRSNRPRFEAE